MEIDATAHIENTTQPQPAVSAMAKSISDSPIATNETELVRTLAIDQFLPGQSSSTDHPLTIEKPACWESLAYELREQIFREVSAQEYFPGIPYFTWACAYSIPPLIEALRLLPRSHAHVVDFFHRRSHLLNFHKGFRFSGMNDAELAGVRSLVLDLEGVLQTAWILESSDGGHKLDKPIWFTSYFSTLPNVQEIRVIHRRMTHYSLYWPATIDYFPHIAFMTEFPFWLQGFRNLRYVEVDFQPNNGHMSRKRRTKVLAGLSRKILKHTGVQGHCIQSSPLSDNWTWEAAEGHVMNWSSNIGWAWNLPYRPRKKKPRFAQFCFELGMEDGAFVLKQYDCERHEHSKCPFPYRDPDW